MNNKHHKKTTILQWLSIGFAITALFLFAICLIYFPDSDDIVYRHYNSTDKQTYAKIDSTSYRNILLKESKEWLKTYRNETNPIRRKQAFQTVLEGLVHLEITPDQEEYKRYFPNWQSEITLSQSERNNLSPNRTSVDYFNTRNTSFSSIKQSSNTLSDTESDNVSDTVSDTAMTAAVEFLNSIEWDGSDSSEENNSLYLLLLTNDSKNAEYSQYHNPLNRLVFFAPIEMESFSPGFQRYQTRMTQAGFWTMFSLLFGMLGIFSPDFPLPFFTDSRAGLILFYERLKEIFSVLNFQPGFVPHIRFYRYDNDMPVYYDTTLDTIRLLI